MNDIFAKYTVWKAELIEKTGVFGQAFFVLIHTVLILLLAKITMSVISSLVNRAVKKSAKLTSATSGKKIRTMTQIILGIMKGVIYILASLSILDEIGLGTTVNSIIAAAGIGGIALGLGVQSLITDVSSGLFLMFENQYAVGDIVQILDYKGTVDHTTLRTTAIRCFSGELVTIPNGKITSVKNFSRGESTANVLVYLDPNTDIEAAIALMEDALAEYLPEYRYTKVSHAEVNVVEVKPGYVKLGSFIKVSTEKQYKLEQDMNRILLAVFRENGIKLAGGNSDFIVQV